MKRSAFPGSSLAPYALAVVLTLPSSQTTAAEDNKVDAAAETHSHAHEAPAAGPGVAESANVGDVYVHNHDQGPGEKRQEEVLTRTPRSGNVITGAVVKDQQIDNLTDVSHYIAGYRPLIAQPRQSRMAIRGVGVAAGSGGSGSASDTGYVVDDVYWSFAGWQWGEFVDISSVEVLYGPTGAAGNKNTNVGSLIFTTQLPSFEDKTTLSVNYGTYNRTRDTVNSTGTLIKDTLAYRFAGYVNRADGWIRDGLTGSTYQDVNRAGLHAQLLAVGDDWSDRLSFTYNGSNEHNDYLKGVVGDTSLIYANLALPSATFFQNMATKLHWPVLTTDPNTPYIARNGRDPAHVLMLTNAFNYQLGENSFKSISAVGYGAFRNNGFSDNELLELGFGSGGMDTYVLQTSQEFRLSSPKDQPIEWTTGLFTFYELLEDRMHHWDFGYNSAAWLGQPGALPGLTPWWLNKAGDFQAALYGQATWRATEQAAITFGLRDSYEDRYSASRFQTGYFYGLPITPAQQEYALARAGGYFTSDSGGFTHFHNGVVGVINPQYQLNDNILLYSLLGHGDKAGSVNTQALGLYSYNSTTKTLSVSSFSQPFDKAEISWDYEFGAKTNWLDGKLNANINLYWNDLYNFQISQTRTIATSPVTVTQAYLGNAPHVRLRGIEFVGRFEPIEHLTLNLNGAYTEARYVSYPDAPVPTDWTFPGGPSTLSLSNTRITGLPWWQINGGYAYHVPIGRALESLGGWLGEQTYTFFHYTNASWFNKQQYTNPWSLVQYWQPAYVMFDAGFGLHTDDRRFQVTLWGKNLFNNRPWQNTNGTDFSFGSSSAPSTVGISTQGSRLLGLTSSYTF